MPSLRQVLLVSLLCAAAWLPSLRSHASPPAPGTLISSQSEVSYLDPLDFVGRTIPSNTVRVRVTDDPGLHLVRDHVLTRSAGAFFEFPHTLFNFGNAAASYTLTPKFNGGPVELMNLHLVLDANGNGTIDPGEPILPFAPYTVTLSPGDSAHVILTGQIEPVLADDLEPTTTLTLGLTATLDGTERSVANTDLLHITGGPDTDAGAFQFNKSVTPGSAAPGETVDYTLVGTNNYATPLTPVNINIDGAIRQRVVVRDELPANLEFVEILSDNGGTPLYHLAGSPLHSYVTTPPADSSLVSGVAWAFESLAAGQSFSVGFRARVGEAASGTIPNTATTYYVRNGTPESAESNVSNLRVPTAPPTIRYYNHHDDSDPDRRVIPGTRLGNPLFVEAVSGACNESADTIDYLTITITSALTGDVESFTGVETEPNSGAFRILPSIPTEDGGVNAVVRHDGIIQTRSRDTLTAEIKGCGGVTVVTEILIDPAGIVFDSRTGAAVAGAAVTLIDVTGAGNGGNPGGPAAVLAEDGFTSVPSTQITGADGTFRFPLVGQSVYRLEVTPPANYTFPSLVPVGLLPANRLIDLPGSFGGTFPVNLQTGAVFLDVPLDTTVGSGFMLEKEASQEWVEVGESVIYTLHLHNHSGASLNGVTIHDHLPIAFRYEPGTTRREGSRVADPERVNGSQLRFPVGDVPDGETVTFTYRVRVEANAHHGDGINRAQAVSMGPPVLRSNTAEARVRLDAGVFDERGIILGRVFVDLDDNGIKTEGEPGVPGVRLVLEDGTWVITDSDGLYSIYGQRPITHVLKVDESTLPPGALLSPFSPRHALDGASRFIDLKRGELHKANFALIYPTPELLEAVRTRREQEGVFRPEIESALLPRLSPDGRRILPYDVRGRDAAGVVGGGQMPPHFESLLPSDTLNAGNTNLPRRPVAAVPQVDLEKLIERVDDPAIGFVDLKDGDILPFRQATVRIKGHVESRLALSINGNEAPENRIGKQVQRPDPPIQGIEYVALNLEPGENELTVTEFDPWGNARGSETIRVVVPDEPARLRMEFSNLQPMADGRTPVDVTIHLEDRNGVPVTSRTAVTLESSHGRWDFEDASEKEDGLQVFLEGGRGVFPLVAPIDPGLATITVSSGGMRTERNLSFLPELRPMLVSGILEGRINLTGVGRGSIQPIGPGDAFEEELRDFAGGGDHAATGRAAFFLKGKIKGDALLTIAYDSDKRDEDADLFRDIEPDEFYPVYGDSSIRGFDAQSTGKLYVRIDKDRSHFLLGDFNTRSTSDVRELGNYNRSFNGARGHWENSRVRATAWTTDASTQQVIREVRANGTSGPFHFQEGIAVPNSEVVEIVTRDREQPSIVLDVEPLSRFSGYDFEPFTGRVLLRRPVPSFDSNMNPLFIRISYEVEQFGEKFWIYGGEAQVKLTDRLEVGASAVEEEDPFEPYSLQSANATVQLTENTYLIGEIARSESFEEGDGIARRTELRHRSGGTDARIFFGESDEHFDNPNSMLSFGREEGGAKVTHQLNDRNRVITEALHSRDGVAGMERQGVRADFEHAFENRVRVTLGGRVSEENLGSMNDPDAREPADIRSGRLRVDSPVPGRPNLTVFGEYEQDVRHSENRVIAAGGDYQVNSRTRLYGRHEFISSLGSRFDLNRGFETNRTLFGVESEYMRDGQFFNEYRAGEGIDGSRAEASTGLRNGWNVAPGVRLHTSLERVTPFGGKTANESTAVTGAIEYTANPDWKGTARLETRFSDGSDSFLNSLGVARRINDNWTGLVRTVFYHQKNETADSHDVTQARILGGLAWRQRELDRWNGLFRYEYRIEDGSPRFDPPNLRRDVHLFSGSANYQPSRRWIFSGRYATKFVREDFGFDDVSDYHAHLLAGRALLELNEHWDFGLNASVLLSENVDNVRYAIGPEVGYAFHKNMRVGLGYNVIGFRDRDFENASEPGVFLTFRVKFDESILDDVRFEPATPRRNSR